MNCDENRIISRDDQRILQLLIDGAWFDYAIVKDAKPPRGVIRYGRPWQEHVPAHSRHLIKEGR